MQVFEITLPAELENDYSPKLDRWDVAIRAVWRLFRTGRSGGNWNLLNELGLTREEHELQLAFAERVLQNVRSDEQIATLLTICPPVLAAAAEALRRYSNLTAASRREHFKMEAVREDLSHRVRQRQRHAKRA